MIHELFGASATSLLNQDQNLPISTPLESSPSPSSSTTITTTTTTTTTTTPPTTTTTSDHQKLRCPRCDSSHTKFCYYNNYNLTQPRHFCKTCRRYWTKGGALRNVPIGGGCRKNKQITITTGAGKLKSMVSSDLGKPSFMHGFELDQPNHNPNNIIWSHPPQTSHLLSLFRATQNPNPNFTPNTLSHMKDHNFMGGSHMGSLGFESLCSSLWKNNQQDQDQGIMSSGTHEGVQNQRLRSSSSANYYHHEETGPLVLGSNVANMTSSSTASSTILDSAPVIAGGDVGFWNQTIPWTTSDLAASNGAYP